MRCFPFVIGLSFLLYGTKNNLVFWSIHLDAAGMTDAATHALRATAHGVRNGSEVRSAATGYCHSGAECRYPVPTMNEGGNGRELPGKVTARQSTHLETAPAVVYQTPAGFISLGSAGPGVPASLDL